MNIEYEAKFLNIDKDEMRHRLERTGAMLVRPEYIQKCIPFYLPKEKHAKNSWLRVRDEGDKITLSLKTIDGEGIEGQKEMCLEVDNFDAAVKLLEEIGCERKSYQETKRELWTLDDAEITIDEWPFLEPFVEIESSSEKSVKNISEKLDFNYADAVFGGVGKLYKMKYGIPPDEVNDLPKIVFDMGNPFLKS